MLTRGYLEHLLCLPLPAWGSRAHPNLEAPQPSHHGRRGVQWPQDLGQGQRNHEQEVVHPGSVRHLEAPELRVRQVSCMKGFFKATGWSHLFLYWGSLCSPGWLPAWELPVSVSPVLGFQGRMFVFNSRASCSPISPRTERQP